MELCDADGQLEGIAFVEMLWGGHDPDSATSEKVVQIMIRMPRLRNKIIGSQTIGGTKKSQSYGLCAFQQKSAILRKARLGQKKWEIYVYLCNDLN